MRDRKWTRRDVLKTSTALAAGALFADPVTAAAPTPTGVTYIYDIAGTSEVVSRLANVFDAWPHVTAPGL